MWVEMVSEDSVSKFLFSVTFSSQNFNADISDNIGKSS